MYVRAMVPADEQPRVLLVDDDRGLRTALGRVLARKGYVVFEASNGNEAVYLASQHSPELAIVDLGLPGMTGFEVLAQLRATLGTTIHTAVLSGQSSLEQKVKAFDAGADDFISKPVDVPELLKKLLAAHRTQIATRDAIEGKLRAERMQLFNSEASSLLAHDINNGIAITLANLQYLRDTATHNEDQRDALRASERALKRISVLSNNFVDIARFEDGVLSPIRSTCDIASLLRSVAEAHEPHDGNGNPSISVECAEGLYAEVDSVLLERTLHNLVGNALRYAGKTGSVQLKVTTPPSDQSTELVISVCNCGSQIPKSLLPTLFEKYRTGVDGQAMRGMGLFFCRMACEAHGGSISAHSADNRTTFTIRFPKALIPTAMPLRSQRVSDPQARLLDGVSAPGPSAANEPTPDNTPLVLRAEQFLEVLHEFCKGQFPRRCSTCSLEFAGFDDYVRLCTPIKGLQNLDVDVEPMNILSMVNCQCGTTLSLSCLHMKDSDLYREFLAVTRADGDAQNWSQAQVFEHLRTRLWAAVAHGAAERH